MLYLIRRSISNRSGRSMPGEKLTLSYEQLFGIRKQVRYERTSKNFSDGYP